MSEEFMPVDPDIDVRDPAETAEARRVEWDVVAVVAAGGVLGAEARYGLGVLAPHASGSFPWMTLVINALGCLLIGFLVAGLAHAPRAPRLTRPFLGTGVLGGFTTFSAFAVDVDTLARLGHWGAALGYLLATVAACLVAVFLATTAVTGVLGRVAP